MKATYHSLMPGARRCSKKYKLSHRKRNWTETYYLLLLIYLKGNENLLSTMILISSYFKESKLFLRAFIFSNFSDH